MEVFLKEPASRLLSVASKASMVSSRNGGWKNVLRIRNSFGLFAPPCRVIPYLFAIMEKKLASLLLEPVLIF